MSAIAHAPAHALGGAHRVLFLVVALTVLAVAAVTVAVVLFTRDDAASGPLTPNVPGHQVVCQNAPVHSAC
jgi:hypothetical protein